ncbi:HAMP domain-containing histidine kinase [Candidatus Saccharibacteria bacterium]|nr:HAMP domain-containing histidine kinase [Candidatus Saccharibacteria bacterium]
MAIDISNYYDRHVSRVRSLYLGVIVGLVPILFLVGAWLLDFDILAAGIIALMFAVLSLISLQPILNYATKPIQTIVRAIKETTEGKEYSIQEVTKIGDGHLGNVVNSIHMLRQENIKAHEETNSYKRLAERLDTLPVGVMVLDTEHKVVYHNKLAPVRVDNSENVFVQLLFDEQNSLEGWLNNIEEQSIHEIKIWPRIQNTLPDQEDRKIYDVLVEFDNSSTNTHTTIITIDRTESYKLDEESMDFIALAAHELRGPITVIRGTLDILQEELRPKFTTEQQKLFERLGVSASRLSGYINNILNVSKFDRRHMQLHLSEDNIQNVWVTVAHDLSLRAITQHRELKVDIPDDLPTVAIDRNAISEVISNLVDNAIKYSPVGGSIHITARADTQQVFFSVQDYGIGMPTSVVGQLFNRFYRSHRSRATVTGTGLGLYISKAIIDSHGGTISVTSKEGEGSIFSFSLPTYATISDKLAVNNNSNQGMIDTGEGWIKNHAMFKG